MHAPPACARTEFVLQCMLVDRTVRSECCGTGSQRNVRRRSVAPETCRVPHGVALLLALTGQGTKERGNAKLNNIFNASVLTNTSSPWANTDTTYDDSLYRKEVPSTQEVQEVQSGKA